MRWGLRHPKVGLRYTKGAGDRTRRHGRVPPLDFTLRADPKGVRLALGNAYSSSASNPGRPIQMYWSKPAFLASLAE